MKSKTIATDRMRFSASKRSIRRDTGRSKIRCSPETKSVFGLWTAERFAMAWEVQGACAICEVPMVDGGRGSISVCADHGHQTGKPRKLLCRGCNLLLGIFEKRRVAFEKYLRETGVGLGV